MWKEAVCHRDGQVSVERRDSAVTVSISHPTPGPRFCSHSLHLPPDTWSLQRWCKQSATEYPYYRIQTGNRIPLLQDTDWQQNTLITGYRLATEYSYYRIQTSLHGLHVMCNVQVPSTLRSAAGNGKPLLQGANLQQNTFITGWKLAIEHLHYRIQPGNRTALLQDTNWQQNTHLHYRTQTATEHLYYKT